MKALGLLKYLVGILLISAGAFAQGTVQGSVSLGLCSGPEGGGQGYVGSVQLVKSSDYSVVSTINLQQSGPYFGSSFPFTFTNVADGTYFVRTNGIALALSVANCTNEVFGREGFFNTADYESATPIVVSGGNTVSSVNMSVDLGLALEGAISTAVSGTVGDCEVILFNAVGEELTRESVSLVAGGAGASGTYSFLVSAGNYFVGVRNQLGLIDINYANQSCVADSCDIAASTPISVVKAAPWLGSTANFALERGGTVSGIVRADDESPISGAIVKLLDSERDLILEMTTDSAGRYASTTGLPDGVYYLEAAKAGFYPEVFDGMVCVDTCEGQSAMPVEISGAASVSNLDFSLTSTESTVPLPNFVGRVLSARRVGGLVSGVVRVRNIGILDAGRFVVKVYAARNADLTGARRLLRGTRVRGLEANRAKEFAFSRSVSARYRWVVLEIDPAAAVYEASEENTAIRKIR